MKKTSTTSTTNKYLTSTFTDEYQTSSSINEYLTTSFNEMTNQTTTYDKTNAVSTKPTTTTAPEISFETTSEKAAKLYSSRKTSHIILNTTLKGTEVSHPHQSTKRTEITSDNENMCNHCTKTFPYLFYVTQAK